MWSFPSREITPTFHSNHYTVKFCRKFEGSKGVQMTSAQHHILYNTVDRYGSIKTKQWCVLLCLPDYFQDETSVGRWSSCKEAMKSLLVLRNHSISFFILFYSKSKQRAQRDRAKIGGIDETSYSTSRRTETHIFILENQFKCTSSELWYFSQRKRFLCKKKLPCVHTFNIEEKRINSLSGFSQSWGDRRRKMPFWLFIPCCDDRKLR